MEIYLSGLANNQRHKTTYDFYYK